MVNVIHLNTLLVIMIMMLLIRPLYLFISQTTGYINNFEKNKTTMSLMVEDKQLLKNYKKKWKKIKKLMVIDLESKATYDDKYINTKIKTV